ncbi:NAD(P)/FAD-dependent oxidoreductase [Actinoplanes ianthinogenes]|nr:FAD-dependent oxidoreductase [Actinoplanes ianthinogenes]
MAAEQTPVLVVGAGIIGLTSAVRLAEQGVPVRIVADLPPARTTSAVAGALWEPYLVEHPDQDRWGRVAYRRFVAEATDPATGVRIVSGVDAIRDPRPVPDWARAMPDFAEIDPAGLPDGFVGGWRFSTALIDMPVYLGFLTDRLAALGVPVEHAHVDDLAEAAGTAPVVVNCTGHRAGTLTGDDVVQPVRGQIVVVRNPGITEFFTGTGDSGTMTYLLPHGDRLLVGGSAEKGADRPEPDERLGREILARAVAMFPELAGAQVLGQRVGFRPYRTPIRVEHEELGGGHVIHNYGHGGAGVTLSWGSAEDVAGLVRELLSRPGAGRG